MYDFLLIAGVVLWGAIALWYLRRPAASAFHPVTFYLIFHGVLFTLRPILAHVQGFDGIYRNVQFMPTPAEKAIVLLGADLALVVFVATAMWIGRDPLSVAPGFARRESQARFTPSLWLTFALCLPLALSALLSGLGSKFAGTSTMIWDAESGVAVNTVNNGYLTDSVLMIGPLAVLFAWAGRFRWWSVLPLAMFILVKAGTGGRWPFIMAAMSAGLLWMYAHRLRWFPPRVLAGLVPLALLFTVVGADRGATIRGLLSGTPAATANYFAERPLESMDFGNMEFFEFVVHVVPGKTGTYDYFLNNLQILTEPVPRVLWPGKPLGAPVKRFQLYDHGRAIGMTFSIAGAGWMQAGWIGIVLWTALFGAFYGALYRWFVRSGQDRYAVALYLILLPIAFQVFRDGILLTVLKTSFFPLLPILVWRMLRFADAPPAMARVVPQPS